MESMKPNTTKLSLCIIAWCMCVLTGLATVAFYKWFGSAGDWLIDLTVSFVLLACLAVGVLSFLGALGAIRVQQANEAPAAVAKT
jgi:hypothetical protein